MLHSVVAAMNAQFFKHANNLLSRRDFVWGNRTTELDEI
jgi:hypothetical protein